MRLLLAVAVVLISAECLAQSASQSTPAPSKHALKEHPSDASGAIRRNVGFGGLPFDKPYAALTSEQKELARSQYNDMPESDEPPFPVGGLKDIYGPIARGHQRIQDYGEVLMDVKIDSSGEAVSVKVLRSPSAEVTKFVARVALLAKYKPGICAGTPCAMEFPIRLNLTAW